MTVPLDLDPWAADVLRSLVGDEVLNHYRDDLARRRAAVDGLTRLLAGVRRRLATEGDA